MMPLLRVSHLNVSFRAQGGWVRAVEDVSFELGERETVALVGESGCGKSVTALSLLRLIGHPVGQIEAKEIVLNGRNLLNLSAGEMRAVRGGEMAMVFQEPMTSLNPVFTVRAQLVEAIEAHRNVTRRAADDLAREALEAVGIPDAKRCMDAYPHELSGGMRQRVTIAMAIACRPALLIADEPTTALDVTIQAQILDLLRHLQDELGMAILLITHDLGVVAEMAHRVLVMYAGQIVESAPVADLFADPKHPYTRGLLDSVPRLQEGQTRLTPIDGTVPDIGAWGPGCRFEPRCPWRRPVCRVEMPSLERVSSEKETFFHAGRCFAISNDAEYNENALSD